MAHEADGDTRAALAAAALRLFAERGFYGASIAAIADELGLTKQALLHHFGSKEKLYGTVLEAISAHLATALADARAEAGTAEDRLKTFFRRFAGWVETNPAETQLLIRELIDNRRRAGTAENWYLKPFLEELTDLALATRRWSGASRARALAGIYQLLGAVNYFAISRPTLSNMFGRDAHDDLECAWGAEFDRALAALLDGSAE